MPNCDPKVIRYRFAVFVEQVDAVHELANAKMDINTPAQDAVLAPADLVNPAALFFPTAFPSDLRTALVPSNEPRFATTASESLTGMDTEPDDDKRKVLTRLSTCLALPSSFEY